MSINGGVKPFALCMTGISGSGKTTLANALRQRLQAEGITIDVIDGDETRALIGELFGHSREERSKMARVNQVIGHYLLKNNISFVLAVVAPYEEIRQQFRTYFGASYIELYVKSSIETCARRDVKGIYKRHREGMLMHLNGRDDMFETPKNSNIIIDTEKLSIPESCNRVIDYLQNNAFIG